jgi:glycosyltransferase involved in cell wall biosynthesis
MDQYKHGERMIDIAESMIGHPLNPLFVVIGTGPFFNQCRERITGIPGLRENAILLGTVENAASLARYFTIGILCSDSEGFPNAVLEYMASGIPVISTAVGDINYILDNGRSGVIIPQYACSDFTDAIGTLLQDPQQQAVLAAAGKQRFESLFTIDIMQAKYSSIYQKLLKECAA